MSDSFTETVTTGWFSRIGSSIKGILVGIIMIIIAFPVLFWNEGRAVKTRKDLDQGAKECLSVNAATVDKGNEGKLVHISGKATTQGALIDEKFGVTAEALKLRRKVEMYQWKENAKSSTSKKLGGKEEKTTTYTYDKVWAEGRIDSGQFKKPDGHNNPSTSLSSQSWSATPITVGAYTLSDELVRQIENFTPFSASQPQEGIAPIDGREVRFNSGQFYLGKNPASPAIGDVKVSFTIAMPTDVSVIAQQNGNSFSPFKGNAGTSINMLQIGNHTADSMFTSARESNKMLTWILRVVGFVVMFIGFSLVFKPFSVVADVLPIAGDIVGVGTGIVAFLLAAPLSLITIAIAWIFYRPVIGIPLLLVAVVGLVFLIRKIAAVRKAKA
ncbi:MAG: TMEM43 family protein [Akkermansiaceae bacterium]|nr:TMEM43 family protein [Akkermansiaceae bacterium]